MKNTMFSLALTLPLFFLMGVTPTELVPSPPPEAFTCSPNTTGSWTITYSQIDPLPCGTIYVTATYSNGYCPAPGNITISKTALSNVNMSPNPLVAAIPDGENTFIVGTISFSQDTGSPTIVKLQASVSGGHTIANPNKTTSASSCI